MTLHPQGKLWILSTQDRHSAVLLHQKTLEGVFLEELCKAVFSKSKRLLLAMELRENCLSSLWLTSKTVSQQEVCLL